MDLNIAPNEFFEENTFSMAYPIPISREDLKILASPGSESSGVSSMDAEEAKVCVQCFFFIS